MAKAISPTLIGPYPGLDHTTAAFTRHKSTEGIGHLPRADTPQLTLHDFHKCQQSPLLSTSLGYEQRRVKRKQSVDLRAGRPANAPLSCPTKPDSPLLIRPLPPRDQFASVLPHRHRHLYRPTTPRLQHTTTSPSLSSTVTTLQSTPTHTPIFRGGSPFERRRIDDRSELVEPLRTKRKFQSPKRAKRLPHPADGSGSGGGISGSSRGENDLWEVYAAVFDPPVEIEGDFAFGTHTGGAHCERRIDEGFEALQHERGGKGVRFASTDVLEGSGPQQSDAVESASTPARLQSDQVPAGTSSYSLSKFEFPVPPGQDNWAGTFGHLPTERPPNSPATLLYRGASFDVVNPHASLLLDVYNLETPAEIDGLLDDYFDEPTTDNMQYDPVTGELPQNPFRTLTESSRRSRKLYQDADLARRSIMRSYDELPSPPPAHLHGSPSVYKSYASMPTPPGSAHDFQMIEADSPRPLRQPPWTTNPFRKWSTALGIGSNVNESTIQAEEGRADAAPSLHFHSVDSIKDRSRRSNPFDLCISDSGSEIELDNISKVMEHGRRDEGGPVVARTSDNEGESSQAITTEPETDQAIREILDGYDYTRFNPFDDPRSSSSSIEIGLGVVIEASNEDDPSDVGPAVGSSTRQPASRDEAKHTPRQAEFPESSLPTPPAPAYTGTRYYSGCSELPTSDQTYGETNQLLQITPEIVQYAPYSPGQRQYQSPFVRRFAEYYAATSMPLKHVRPRADSDPSKPVASTYKPVLANDKENMPPDDSQDRRGENAPDIEDLLEGERTFQFVEPDLDEVLQRRANRASSRYANDAESVWESEFTDSNYDLPRAVSEQTLASYADTSVAGSQHRPSIDEGIPNDRERHVVSDGLADDGPPKIGIGMSKTFSQSSTPTTDEAPANKLAGFSTANYYGVSHDAQSDRRRLIENYPGNLRYSASIDTFTTIRTPRADTPDSLPRILPPFGGEISTGELDVAKKGEKLPLKPKLSLRGKVGGQTGLKDLHLVKPKARDRPPGRWTDAQHLARSRGWIDDYGARPYMTANSPLAKYTNPHSSSFDAKLSDKRLLVDPKLSDYYPPVLYEEREELSKECLNWIVPFPVLTLAYGLGAFDDRIKRKTNGRIKTMAPDQKYEALYVYTPLTSLLWAIAAVITAILVMAFQPGGLTSGGNSAPF